MGLNGFLFNFAAQGWMLFMTSIGGLVLILAWAISLRSTTARLGPDKPIFLRFAVAVIINPIGLFLVDLVSDAQHRAVFADLIIMGSIAISIGTLFLSLKGLKGRDDPASKFLRRSTRVLLICAGIALLAMTLGIPGELETWKS